MKRIKAVIAIVIISILLISAVSIYQSKYTLTVSNYQLSTPKLSDSLRIVQLTDLHNSSFGEGNQKLIEKVKEQSPDIILITGDMINMNAPETETAVQLVEALCDFAPVYFSLGNHEIVHRENYGIDVVAMFEAAGATVMDMEYEDVEIDGQKLRIGGLYGYALPEKYLSTGEATSLECAFLSEFEDTQLYTILMCHMPVCWIWNDGIDEWNVDSVYAGHAHGGQIIIPGVGGTYAPDMGFFPGNLEGLHYSEDHTKALVLSRGLGSGTKVPRFNNIPEIVTVDLIPEGNQ